MKSRFYLTGIVAILAFTAWSCGDAPNPAGPAASLQDNPGRAAKPALAQQASESPTTVVATVLRDNAPVADVVVGLSRSISGVRADYQWTGTTDLNGRASIQIPVSSRSASGYYFARVTNPGSDEVIGKWTSIPIRGGREMALTLPIGGSAKSVASSVSEATFRVRIENVSAVYPFSSSGAFTTPVGASAPAAIGPGGAYEFSFDAGPGSRLSFATMFVHSNDFFYAPGEAGIALWDANGQQVSGDVTSQVRLWDSGTEVNQEPGLGADQAPRQGGANTGASDANATVRLAPDTFSNLPLPSSVLRVTVTPTSATGFHVRIANVSGTSTLTPSSGGGLAVPLAPGVWVVHSASAPLFTEGAPDSGEGLEALAEDGNPAAFAQALAARSGLTVPLAPGAWAVHGSNYVLYQKGHPDRGEGLEALAEDGNPAALGASLMHRTGVTSSGAFTTPVGGSGPAPIFPGEAYEFTLKAYAGYRLSFATMFVQSNDFFYAPASDGIPLWDVHGNPVQGDVSSRLRLWDAGTEVNQTPGAGLDQAPHQSGANTGAPDADNRVRPVWSSPGNLPSLSDVIRVTITPEL